MKATTTMAQQRPFLAVALVLAALLCRTCCLAENVCGVSYEPCPKGCWNANHRVDAGGHRLCAPVRPGFYGPYYDDRRFPCQPGTFSNIDTAEYCELSQPGSFVSSVGATVSTLCPPGTYSQHYAAEACEPCNTLFFDGSGSDSAMVLPGNDTDSNTTILYCLEPTADRASPTSTPTSADRSATHPPSLPDKGVPVGSIIITGSSPMPTITSMAAPTLAPTTPFMGSATSVATRITATASPTTRTTKTPATPAPSHQAVAIEMTREQEEPKSDSTALHQQHHANSKAIIMTVVAVTILLALAMFAYKRKSIQRKEGSKTIKTTLPLTEQTQKVEKDKRSVTTTRLQDDDDGTDDKSAISKFDEIYLEGEDDGGDEEESKTRTPFPPVITAPVNHSQYDNEDAMTTTVAGGLSVWSFRTGLGTE